MAQTTQITIDNQTFPSFRQKLNESLSALNTLNSGTSRPSSAVAGTIWLDVTNSTSPTLKFFDGNDDISLATIDYTANTVNWLDSSVTLTSPVEISGNSTSGAEIRLPEDTDNGSNYVALKASDSISSDLTFTLPSADGTCGQAIVTDGCGNLSFASVEGRTGTVNWDTTAKIASFTAVSGNGYFVNTTSGAITVTLPASPIAGDIVAVADYANTFATNNLTIARNGSLINGSAFNYKSSTNGISLTFVYVDGTRGWKNVNDGTTDATGISDFIVATGGTVTCCGDYKIHTFTSPGTFTVTSSGNPLGSTTVDYLVVAGGGGGGFGFGAGGGGGGYRESSGTASGCYSISPLGSCVSALPVTIQGYPITVGAGGAASPTNATSCSGNNSVFSTITSTGGGGGGGFDAGGAGAPGGSGGARGISNPSTPSPGIGLGNTPPVSPPQGNDGGTSFNAGSFPGNSGGGGGGATAVGGTASCGVGGNGGAGGTSSINGTPTQRGGGGGGGSGTTIGTGSSGGGNGGNQNPANPNIAATAGTANTGGGGGSQGGSTSGAGAAGGSGIVLIRYKFQ